MLQYLRPLFTPLSPVFARAGYFAGSAAGTVIFSTGSYLIGRTTVGLIERGTDRLGTLLDRKLDDRVSRRDAVRRAEMKAAVEKEIERLVNAGVLAVQKPYYQADKPPPAPDPGYTGQVDPGSAPGQAHAA